MRLGQHPALLGASALEGTSTGRTARPGELLPEWPTTCTRRAGRPENGLFVENAMSGFWRVPISWRCAQEKERIVQSLITNKLAQNRAAETPAVTKAVLP
jgi:hypothetical protein